MPKELDNDLNPKSPSYVPTMEEMGIPKDLMRRMETEFDDPAKNDRNEKEYDAYLSRWKSKHREKLKKAEMQKQEKRALKASAHWFNNMPEKELIQLIDDSRRFADQVFDELNSRVSSAWELQYIEKLRLRVKSSPISIVAATTNKVRRFPGHIPATNSLSGSIYAFYRLWSHVFKSASRINGSIDTARR